MSIFQFIAHVEIWSHARYPPLQPAADLCFDLRTAPNPPKHIRDRFDGRDKRLRELLVNDQSFSDMLEKAVAEVVAAAAAKDTSVEGSNHQPKGDTGMDCNGGDFSIPLQSSRGYVKQSSGMMDNDDDDDDDDDDGETILENDQEVVRSRASLQDNIIPSIPTIRMSCSCVRGRHRSVAFAEELRKALPRTFGIEVFHRDVDTKTADLSKSRRRNRKAAGIARDWDSGSTLE